MSFAQEQAANPNPALYGAQENGNTRPPEPNQFNSNFLTLFRHIFSRGNDRGEMTPGAVRPDTVPSPLEARTTTIPLSGQMETGWPGPGAVVDGAVTQPHLKPATPREKTGPNTQTVQVQPFDDYAARAQASFYNSFPTMPAQPGAVKCRAVKIATASVAQDMLLPDGSVYVRFSREGNVDFYVSLDGAAERPTVAQTAVGVQQSLDSAILNPSGWYFIKGRNVVSVLSLTAGAIIVAECIVNV